MIVASQFGDIPNGFSIAVHIGIDRRTQVFLLASATNSLLHGVLYVSLPEKATFTGMGCLPMVILPFQRRKHRDYPVLATIHQITAPQRMGYPRGVIDNLLHGLAVIAMIPCIHDLVEVRAVAQPTALVDMVSHARGNEVILVGVATIDEKLRHRIADGRLFDMFAKRPPAEVPHFLEVLVGTVEEGHVLRHPLPCLAIRNSLDDVLILHRIEVVDIVFVVVVAEEGAIPVGRTNGHGDEVGDRERGFWFALTCIVEGAVPVGWRVDIREAALRTRAEHDSLDAFHRGEEHALTSLLAVDKYFCHATTDTQHDLKVVGGVGLVFTQSAIAGTTFAAHDALVSQLNT